MLAKVDGPFRVEAKVYTIETGEAGPVVMAVQPGGASGSSGSESERSAGQDAVEPVQGKAPTEADEQRVRGRPWKNVLCVLVIALIAVVLAVVGKRQRGRD